MLGVSSVRRQGQLPAETNEFVGREAELRLIGSLLLRARLVTLTGPGGVGKTRVALRAAAAVAGRFRDGVRLVELSALRDPGLLPHTVARLLGLPEQSPGSQRDAVLSYLHDRRLLLILDTCEHLIDACADFAADVLAAAPSVTLLATSREPLDVTGEATCAVGPLPAASAVELFARRSAAASPGFSVTDANRAIVAGICQAADGIPLAIELAAGRLHELTLAELGSRTANRLALLNAGTSQVGRHATVRNAIAWSYDLCTPVEQAVWARLSVFPGSFDASGAANVVGSDGLSRTEVLETIIRLVDKSVLIRADTLTAITGGGEPRARFRMLDAIREFGAERLAASGDEAATRDRHLAWCLTMARDIRDHFLDDDQLARFAALDRERSSIRGALEYALDSPPEADARLRDGADLAISLYTYWMAVNQFQEGKYWLGKVRDRFPGVTPQRAWALSARSYLSALQGETAEGAADGRAGIALAESVQAPELVARAYLNLGIALVLGGQLDEAAMINQKAEDRLTDVGDRTGLLMLCVHDGHRCQLAGHPEQTFAWYQRFENHFGTSGEQWLHGWMHLVAAMALFQLPGKEGECQDVLLLALNEKHELNDTSGIAYALEILGWLTIRSGRHARAAWLFGAADALWSLIGVRVSGTPTMEEYHRQAVAACRAALGTERFDALFARGAELPLSHATALAAADADDPDAEPPVMPRPGTLTTRETEIAILAAAGWPATRIADHLFAAPQSVAADIQTIFDKLGIATVEQLTRWVDTHVHRPRLGRLSLIS